MKMRSVGIAALAIAMLVGCQNQPGEGNERELIGTGLGAILGGILGKQVGGNTTGVIVGAAAGALIGNRLGAWLDDDAKKKMAEASKAAAQAPTGQQITWETQDSNTGKVAANGWVRPVSEPKQAADGTVCRDLEQSASRGTETRTERVTYCQASTPASTPPNPQWVRPPRQS